MEHQAREHLDQRLGVGLELLERLVENLGGKETELVVGPGEVRRGLVDDHKAGERVAPVAFEELVGDHRAHRPPDHRRALQLQGREQRMHVLRVGGDGVAVGRFVRFAVAP